jgi:diguanylate cyclase (GGDEF)-like protein
MLRWATRDDVLQELVAARERIAELEADHERAARTDPLTGCLSLSYFRSRVSEEVERARRYRRPLAIGLLDVDGFRAMQLRHGFAAGDDLLKAVGNTLRNFTRALDLVCRTGGDEFAILLPETSLETARECFGRILLELEVLETGPLSCVSMSIGVAEFESGCAAEELLDRAAGALARARAAGGARLEAHGEEHGGLAPGAWGQRDTVEALAIALAERDRYTAEHSETVVAMAGAVASTLGLPADEVDRVRAAARLHDIGKVAIPDAVLHKAGPLDDAEWKVMQEHPVVGERILRVVPGLGSVARIVRHEHERWNGTGYPDGLAGEAIPIGSRIILACDAYHAMTSDRPYREAMSHAEAVGELSRGAGGQFDPQVTAALIGWLYGRRQNQPPEEAAAA